MPGEWEDAPQGAGTVAAAPQTMQAAPQSSNGWEDAPGTPASQGRHGFPSDEEINARLEAQTPSWQQKKLPFTGTSFNTYLENDPAVNLGLWLRKKITGEKTEGTLRPGPALKPEKNWAEITKDGLSFMAQHPGQAVQQLAQSLTDSPELTAASLGIAKIPGVLERLAVLGKQGNAVRQAAYMGEHAVQGAAMMGAAETAKQLGQREHLQVNEIEAAAATGAALVPALAAVGKVGGMLWKAGDLGAGAKPKGATPTLDTLQETVSPEGDINFAEKSATQANIEAAKQQWGGGKSDAQLNAEKRAYDLMQSGASKKTVEAVVKKNPLVGDAMEAIRQKRAGATGAMKDVWQGEVLGPETGAEQMANRVTGEAGGTDLTAGQPRPWKQLGEADPRLLAALGVGTTAGLMAYAYPDQFKKNLAGAGVLALGTIAMKEGGLRGPLDEALARSGRTTLKTFERLPKNQEVFSKTQIENEMRRAGVSKAEREILKGVLDATPDKKISANDLAAGFRMQTGDLELTPVRTMEEAISGVPAVRTRADAVTTLYKSPEWLDIPSDQVHFTGEKNVYGWTRKFNEGGIDHVMEIQSPVGQKQVEAPGELSTTLKHAQQRLVQEELSAAGRAGQPVVRFATPETMAKIEGFTREDGKLIVPREQAVFDRYKRGVEPYLKQEGGKEVRDAEGHTWIEVPSRPSGLARQAGKTDLEFLAKIVVGGLGMTAGAYLAGDDKIAGAVLGGIAGAGLLRLPATFDALGKTLSYKVAAGNAARIVGVVGIGTYLGHKEKDPVMGAVLASAILLGRNALPKARPLVADDLIRLRNGNIAAQTRILHNLVRDINAAVPDAARRSKISEAVDSGNPSQLQGDELKVYRAVNEFNRRIGEEAKDADVIKGMRENYLTYIVEKDPAMDPSRQAGILDRIFGGATTGGQGGSPKSRFGRQGKYETLAEINAALKGSGLKLKTTDIGEILSIYGKSMRQAIENKNLLDSLKSAKTVEGQDLLVRADKNGNLPTGYERLNHAQMLGYGVHPDLVPALKTVLHNSDPNMVTKGLLALSMAVKRVNVTGSLFHAKSLGEVYLNAMGKDILPNPRAPIDQALKLFHEGGVGDNIDLMLRHGLKMEVPLDISETIIGDVGKAADYLFGKAGVDTSLGEKTAAKLDFVNKKLDKLTWDYLHAGIKGAVALKEFEGLTLANAEAHARSGGKVPLKTREQIAREVATYTNDLAGGLDWFGIAADAKTQLGRNLGMTLASPSGQRLAQILLFAPDWTLSTLRSGFRAFGESHAGLRGLWKPENSTDLYRRYALRSSLYWLTLLNGINMMTAGKPIWQNKDPTRIEFKDGTSMQAGKHTFEATHAVTDPVKFAYNKLGYTPRMVVDTFAPLASGKPASLTGLASRGIKGALPFTVGSSQGAGLTYGQRVERAAASAVGFPIYGQTAEQKALKKEARKESRRLKREKKLQEELDQ